MIQEQTAEQGMANGRRLSERLGLMEPHQIPRATKPGWQEARLEPQATRPQAKKPERKETRLGPEVMRPGPRETKPGRMAKRREPGVMTSKP
jgi:hypothetical protein